VWEGCNLSALLIMSFLSGFSTPAGAFIVTGLRRLSPTTLAFLLALASGVMITVTAADLVPLAVQTGGWRLTLLGVAVGAAGLAVIRDWTQPRATGGPLDTARLRMLGWFVAAAIALHDLPEGMAIGAGSTLAPRVGLVIAVAIALHNIPEGMSIAAPLAMGGVSRRRIWTATLLIGLVTPLGTFLAYALGTLSPVTSSMVLALAAGAMTYVAGWNTLPESRQLSRPAAWLGLLAGGLLMLGTHAALAG